MIYYSKYTAVLTGGERVCLVWTGMFCLFIVSFWSSNCIACPRIRYFLCVAPVSLRVRIRGEGDETTTLNATTQDTLTLYSIFERCFELYKLPPGVLRAFDLVNYEVVRGKGRWELGG